MALAGYRSTVPRISSIMRVEKDASPVTALQSSCYLNFTYLGCLGDLCKTVSPMLSDRCLPVLSSPVMYCLSVYLSDCLWRWCIVAKRFDGSR